MSYFPLFMELKDRDCLVVGGGRVAWRKVKVLMDFGARVSVVAPEIISEIGELGPDQLLEREFLDDDVWGRILVVAATDDETLNQRISRLCQARSIPVNVVDQIQDCSFIFPAYVKRGEVVAAFSSGGQSPVMTQYLKAQIKPVMTEKLGELAACLGSLRDVVHSSVQTETARKHLYEELLQLGLQKGENPETEEIWNVMKKYMEQE
ncbi:MAG: bifunctional precorrin-2 dehydrogenase/sirohydrochlorin ferrochelatase [Eubacterium sp.]|nr:bifunctional precorrin-2 dehydrogenase/sirohydrochlorin ferrochelatase [Eubacterium sp.]